MHWSDNNDFLESALTIGYCFSLDKDFYKLALDKYCGESFDEFKSDLLNSPGNNIDPYWRLK